MEMADKFNQHSKEALLNEEKGNLFEFLVAKNLSRLHGVENNFFLDLNPSLKNNMTFYEESLQNNHPELIPKLIKLSDLTAKEIYKKINLEVSNIFLVGKIAANLDKEKWHEADIVIKTKNELLIPLSVKLTKDNSYMNTKSAGAKSFISKYFQHFKHAEKFQEILNKEIDQAFFQMAHRLYQLDSLEFKGKFDETWKEKWSELPGELPPEFREVIFVNYTRVAAAIHQQLVEMLTQDSATFINSLAPLCGMGDSEIIQVSCYHQDHQLKTIEIKKIEDFFLPGMNVKIEELKSNMSAFDIYFGNIILQIRVKPMNKFTTPSYKINCSIKFNKEN